LEEGKFYGKDAKVEENERILHIVQIPEDYLEYIDDPDFMFDWLGSFLHDSYGVYSDSFYWEILDEDGLQETLKNPQPYVRSVGNHQSKVRTQVLDKLEETKSLLKDIEDEKVKSLLIGKMKEVA